MKKWLYCIWVLLLVLSCVGQKDDPEPEPQIDPEPEIPVVTPPEKQGDFFRRSLILDFTGTWCVNCPKMEAAITEAQKHRPGRIECISVHCLVIDKMALMPLSKDLATRFGVTAYPSAVTDLDASSLITTSSAELLLAKCDRLLATRPKAAGIKASTSLSEGKANVSLEAKPVRDGVYSLHCVLLEDGLVYAQTGGSQEHVHNNVLRAWVDSSTFDAKDGDTLEWTCSADATEGMRLVAFLCKDGLVDNLCSCKLGDNIDYQYEPE